MQNPDRPEDAPEDTYDDLVDEDLLNEYDEEEEEEDYIDEELDEGFVDEEGWEEDILDFDEDVVEGAGAGAQKKKRKGPSFNTSVILIALVVGFAVLVYQVVSKRPEVIQKFTTALHMTGSTDGPIFGAQKDEEASPTLKPESATGFLHNPQGLSPDSPVTEAPPMPSPIASEEGGDSVLTPMPSSMSAAEGYVDATEEDVNVPRPPQDVPPSDSPSGLSENVEESGQESAGLVSQELPSPVSKEAPVPNAAEEILKNAVAEREQKKMEREDSLAEDLKNTEIPEISEPPAETDLLETPVDLAEETESQKTETVKTEAAEEAPAADPVTQVVSAGLEKKINLLLERLDSMEGQIKEIQSGEAEAIKNIQTELSSLKQEARLKEEAQDVPAVPAAVPSSSEAEKKSGGVLEAPAPAKQTAAPKKQPVKKVASQQAPVWKLRAAQPGRAWVSRQNEREMKAVRVGDVLAGIGQIEDISYVNGRWVVRGSKGSIRQ